MTDDLLAATLSATHFCSVKTNPPEACLQAGFGDGTKEIPAMKIWQKQEIFWYTSLSFSFQVFRDCVKDQEAKRKEGCDLVDWALETQLIKIVSHEYPSTETILWS